MNAVEAVARVAEVTIGLGVPPVYGCKLCRRPIPCPTHLGEAIAQALLADPAACRAIAADVVGRIEAACDKADALTQESIGRVSEHWRGRDYADGLDAGIETTTGLVRAALRGDQS